MAAHAALADSTPSVCAGVVRADVRFDHLGRRSVAMAYEAQGPQPHRCRREPYWFRSKLTLWFRPGSSRMN